MFDQVSGFHITDLANVRGAGIPEGEKIRRIEAASDRDLALLRDECLTQGSEDTRKLVEREQGKRLTKQIPEWRMWSTWVGIAGLVIAILSWLFPRS